jgi:hypothetical protein
MIKWMLLSWRQRLLLRAVSTENYSVLYIELLRRDGGAVCRDYRGVAQSILYLPEVKVAKADSESQW